MTGQCAAALARPGGWWTCVRVNCDGFHYFRPATEGNHV
jgi:hypothetical protein